MVRITDTLSDRRSIRIPTSSPYFLFLDAHLVCGRLHLGGITKRKGYAVFPRTLHDAIPVRGGPCFLKASTSASWLVISEISGLFMFSAFPVYTRGLYSACRTVVCWLLPWWCALEVPEYSVHESLLAKTCKLRRILDTILSTLTTLHVQSTCDPTTGKAGSVE